ncbi:glycerol-3-phosphate responsive antiterminator [Paenibacillus sp. UMB7766-LJ446]|jgi:glycerol uptake operon antiterminator|uniref:glycerol-3-phosphate responsive antiterminator n=1 Tax=Paenibacillus TaxID=44249 RepID=UPI0004068E7E|nr:MULTISPECIES: glycerol-3-phosphate responsive antiterminator [Paenibacillus]KGP85496.1 glycerol-3-phosphate responsive antiterminator GlpP [Paenibacillus sp. MAEPY2]KGP87285.1 glycerol-3-phosphate responsive antiterminator GlpP [Paenibacillus sp. MAEPY1]MDK8189152.1 glycerol-3-phosphate responsive antiterminator [Paenibacillus sp. UMB7766-LJ446]OZQ69984.1 glycerol-3-phosphate responsive antiterminator GlpP [Paenibacillus taichungensis]HBU84306.1 glycerol-3-phosphate responsive antiterminato
MAFYGQQIIPAAKNMKQFEAILDSDYKFGVFLDTHVAQLRNLYQMARGREKNMLLHADLVQGLKNDEYAAQYLCQEIKPFGIISTRAGVITTAKKKGILAIQRLFMLDTIALEKSYSLVKKTQPDFIEVLPGVMSQMIPEVSERTGIPILAGGLIRTVEEVELALAAGATAVTTSNKSLFDQYSL